MRKTLFAMLGLVAIGLWAMPAVSAPTSGGLVADGPAKVHPEAKPGLSARPGNYSGTMSGTVIKQTAVSTLWFLYPGACVDRALGTWAAKSFPVSDSLQPTRVTGPPPNFPNSAGYAVGQPDFDPGTPVGNEIAYTRADQSLAEILWHVASSTDPATERPLIIDGSRMLWCGKFDANWVTKVGYPNLTAQILYIWTGNHSGNPYHLTFDGQLSAELNYDYVYFIGGGSFGEADERDPLQNRRDYLDDIKDNGSGGPHGDSPLIVAFTGSITSAQTVAEGVGTVIGAGAGDPNTVAYDLTINGSQAVYVYMTADCLFSSEDGLWPDGNGQLLDNIATNDNGSIYAEQVPYYSQAHPGILNTDEFGGNVVIFSGSVIVQPGDDIPVPNVSCRVPAGVGEFWQLASGTDNPTSDNCSPQKALAADLFFEGGDPGTNAAINKQFNSIVGCAFPVPAGTASVLAIWDEYLDLPRFAGYVQYCEFRFFKCEIKDVGGVPTNVCAWSNWKNTSAGGGVTTGANQAWLFQQFDELAEAVQADSVQIRYNLQCIPPFAADRQNCSTSQVNPLLYDDLRLQVTTGVPAPLFGIFPGSVAQSMFVDGTIKGTNCQTLPCWPGNRGTDLGTQNSHNIAVHDNFNAPVGDSITVAIVTGLRKNGMGVNWHYGLDKSVNAGEVNYTLAWPANTAHTNASYNPAYDVPRMIYRIFDPATKNWSAFDSTEIVPNVAVSDADGAGPAAPDTVIIDSEYSINWPPYDKVGLNLPGGFTVNGNPAYNAIRFLPRGSRIQYYFKGVDINGGVTYAFETDRSAFEVADLPTLPGGTAKAPDIIEMDVLPSVYAAGPAGSLLAGKTNTPLINLDATYTLWSYQQDPVTQALRGLGVRADRYRETASGTTAHNFGGHELPGKRPDRLSNYLPNYLEYPIADSMATWYRIMIETSHTRTTTAFSEQDASLAEQWWRKDTGSDQGDRCIYGSGDDMFNTLLNTTGVDITLQISLAQNVFGVNSAINAWTGTSGTAPNGPYPTIDDRFANPTAGPGLGSAGGFTYPVDGGCPGPNKFDGLVKMGSSDVQNAVFYPSGTEVAGVANMTEKDNITDKDRNKALAYGFSIQFVRQIGIPTTAANYVRSGVANRMQILYKFLASCRGQRTGAAADTGKCWPCPTDANLTGEWATLTGFNTGTYGPLYPIQARGLATGVEIEEATAAPRYSNSINGSYPNPFNPQTTIRFTSGQAGKATIRIFSVSGQLVRTLTANVTAGPNNLVHWNGKMQNGTPVSSGVYFFKVSFPDGRNLKSENNLVLVK